MEVVTVDLSLYTIDLQYLTDVATAYCGRLLHVTAEPDGLIAEYGFEPPDGTANAQSFRDTLNLCFVRRLADPAADS